MTEAILARLVYLLVPVAWLSTGLLVWFAMRPPRGPGALVERAWIAVIIALFLTSAAALVYNTETGELLVPLEVARVAFRVAVLLLGLVPVAWLVLWLLGRLGGKE